MYCGRTYIANGLHCAKCILFYICILLQKIGMYHAIFDPETRAYNVPFYDILFAGFFFFSQLS